MLSALRRADDSGEVGEWPVVGPPDPGPGHGRVRTPSQPPPVIPGASERAGRVQLPMIVKRVHVFL